LLQGLFSGRLILEKPERLEEKENLTFHANSKGKESNIEKRILHLD
jgi:hypothetical protein